MDYLFVGIICSSGAAGVALRSGDRDVFSWAGGPGDEDVLGWFGVGGLYPGGDGRRRGAVAVAKRSGQAPAPHTALLFCSVAKPFLVLLSETRNEGTVRPLFSQQTLGVLFWGCCARRCGGFGGTAQDLSPWGDDDFLGSALPYSSIIFSLC